MDCLRVWSFFSVLLFFDTFPIIDWVWQYAPHLRGIDYTVKPVWNDHPWSQEKVVFSDRWSFQTDPVCMESNGRYKFSQNRKRSSRQDGAEGLHSRQVSLNSDPFQWQNVYSSLGVYGLHWFWYMVHQRVVGDIFFTSHSLFCSFWKSHSFLYVCFSSMVGLIDITVFHAFMELGKLFVNYNTTFDRLTNIYCILSIVGTYK